MVARKQRKLRNRINFRTAYGCNQTDHITAVKSWQGHQQHFLQKRPGIARTLVTQQRARFSDA